MIFTILFTVACWLLFNETVAIVGAVVGMMIDVAIAAWFGPDEHYEEPYRVDKFDGGRY